MDAEIRAYFDEFRGQLGHIAARLDGIDARLDRLEAHAERTDARLEALEASTETLAREARRTGILLEHVEDRLRFVAEGVVTNERATERLRGDLARDIDERFSIVHAAFGVIRGDLEALRAR